MSEIGLREYDDGWNENVTDGIIEGEKLLNHNFFYFVMWIFLLNYVMEEYSLF